VRMNARYTININEDVAEKFKLALTLQKEDADAVIEKFMKQYISVSFALVSQTYKAAPGNTPVKADAVYSDTGKANNRIPKWAMKPEQNNHRIIKAFFEVEKELGKVPLTLLEKHCSDESHYPAAYVRDFRGNFNQMKTDAPHSHGKVFEVESGIVLIWGVVQDKLLEYREYFAR